MVDLLKLYIKKELDNIFLVYTTLIDFYSSQTFNILLLKEELMHHCEHLPHQTFSSGVPGITFNMTVSIFHQIKIKHVCMFS